MNKKSVFRGESKVNILANYIYKRLISREWFTYNDIIKDVDIKNEEPEKISVSQYYNPLKNAFAAVCNAVERKEGPDCIEIRNSRPRRYRYVGNNPNPLAEEIDAKIVSSLKQYFEFCQDSAGFLPSSWLEEFFGGYIDLLDIKNKRRRGEQIIESGIDRSLKNIGLLPFLYKAIKAKLVLDVHYKSSDGQAQHLIFHPHYLKEHNGRWFLFGHAEKRKRCNNLALDRILSRPEIVSAERRKYIAAPPNYYADYFKHIVGVSHIEDAQPVALRLRARSRYMFTLTETKPIHNSQRTIRTFDRYDDGEYGEFLLDVEINKELIARILMMGDDVEIVEPMSARQAIKEMVDRLFELYRG